MFGNRTVPKRTELDALIKFITFLRTKALSHFSTLSLILSCVYSIYNVDLA